MKKVLAAVLFTVVAGFYGCSEDTTGPTTTTTGNSHEYFPTSKGSTWTLVQQGGIRYIITITGDSVLNGKNYVKQISDISSTVGLTRISKDTVFSYDVNTKKDMPVLISKPQGATWTNMTYAQDGTPNEQEYTVMESGLTREVGGKSFSNVLRVHLTTSIVYGGQKFPMAETDYYYAKNIGFIEFVSNVGHIYLESYTIK